MIDLSLTITGFSMGGNTMSTLHRAVAMTLAALSLGALTGGAQAAAVANHTYYFFGGCDDCTLNAPPGAPVATLVLSGDYVEGNPLRLADLVTFSYAGSNLVDPYTVYGPGVDPLWYADGISGSMDSSPGAKDFRIDFTDGLRFESTAAGNWYTCGPKGDVFYSGTCDYLHNNDFAQSGASWNAAVNPVPEPATFALVGWVAMGLFLRRPAARTTA